jgi:hypothetical protein
MGHWHRLASDFETLEIAAQRAGSAWACPFASSAEYEAALIQERRAAGAYRSGSHWPAIVAVAAGLGIVLAFVL